MDFDEAARIAATAMAAQATRLRTISENLANADTTASEPGIDPYRRKIVSFKDALDKATGQQQVTVDRITEDSAPFQMRYMPGHPAADGRGYVRFPNVNPLVELADLKEAQRSYEADVDIVQATNTMKQHALDLLKT
jgi:flagellar basal-body rod protein FlgC